MTIVSLSKAMHVRNATERAAFLKESLAKNLKYSLLVVHCKQSRYDVYIGRPSKWGNPFQIGRDGDRDEVIAKYTDYIVNREDLLAEVHLLSWKVLGCWCRPRACHGDVLATLADIMLKLKEGGA